MTVRLERVRAKDLKAGEMQAGLPTESERDYEFGVWGIEVVLMQTDGKDLPAHIGELWTDRVHWEP